MSNKNTSRVLALIIFPIGILCSCGTVKLSGYTAINASSINEVETENFSECSNVTRFYYNNSENVLDGKFRIKYANKKYCFVELDSGLLVNEYFEYFGKNISVQERYKNGLRDGLSMHYAELNLNPDAPPVHQEITVNYVDGVLNGQYTFVEDSSVTKIGTYTDGFKNDTEFWFNANGDTLKTLNFMQDADSGIPAILNDVELKEKYNYVGKVDVIGLISNDTERRVFYADLVGMYADFMCKEMVLVEDLFENKFLLLFKQDILIEIIEL